MILQALGYCCILRYGISVSVLCAMRQKNRINYILRSILKIVSCDWLASDTDLFKALRCSNYIKSPSHRNGHPEAFLVAQNKAEYLRARCLRPKERFRAIHCSARCGQRTRNYFIPSCLNRLPASAYCLKTKYTLKQILRRVIIQYSSPSPFLPGSFQSYITVWYESLKMTAYYYGHFTVQRVLTCIRTDREERNILFRFYFGVLYHAAIVCIFLSRFPFPVFFFFECYSWFWARISGPVACLRYHTPLQWNHSAAPWGEHYNGCSFASVRASGARGDVFVIA